MKPTLPRILIFALLVGLCPVPVSDFLIGIGFAPISFVLFWIGLGFFRFPDPLHLIYLVESVLYMAVFWFIAGRVTRMAPRPRGLLGAALLAGSILLWYAPIHSRIEQGIGEQKPLAVLFVDEYHQFQFQRALQMPVEPKIYKPQEGMVPTVAVPPRIESMQTARPDVVQQPAAKKTKQRIEE